MTVYVVNKPLRFDRDAGHLVDAVDLSSAGDFGEVVHLLPDGELRDGPAGIVRTLRRGLAAFGPSDLLLLCGDPRAMAWAAAIAADATDGDLRLLHWVRSERCYQVVHTQIFDMTESHSRESAA